MLISLASQAQTKTNMEKVGAIEVVQYRGKEGVSDEEMIEKLKLLNDVVSQFDGFISRKFSKDEEGNWMDLVFWTSKEKAIEASKIAEQNPIVHEVLAIVDEKTMTFRHYTPLFELDK